MPAIAEMEGKKRHMGLEGKTILVTRPRKQAQELVDEIQQRRGTAVVIPMIRIVEPENWAECDAAIAGLSQYNGIIFTSGNAVEEFFQRCELKKVFSPAFEGKEVYAVGERTSELLKEYGIAVTFTPKEFSSAALRKYFREENSQGKRFLFPKGNLTKGELPQYLRSLGAIVDEIDVYTNLPPTAGTLQELRARFMNCEFDVVTFASPTAIKRFHDAVTPDLFGAVHNRTKLAVIGPTTREAAEQLGYSVDSEAGEATSAAMIKAIVHTLATAESWSDGYLDM